MDAVAAGRLFGKAATRLLWRARVSGTEHVPAGGPVVLVANHTGLLDGPIAFTFCPRPVRFLVKRSFFSGPAGVILRGVQQIPITQNSGDREALRQAREHLNAGGVIGIFPEGTRGLGDVASVQAGAAWLALQTGAQIVPVALHGTAGRTKSALPRPGTRMSVTFGAPFDVVGDEAVRTSTGRARLAAASDLLKERLSAHVRAAR